MSDISVINQGSIVLLQPNTDKARGWLHENIGRDNGYQPYWPIAVVEPRYVQDILGGLKEDGLAVEEV